MRIVIAEDSVLLRAGLTGLLADAGEEVIAAVDNADDLLTVVERHQPDLAVVDVRMPPTHTDDGLRERAASLGGSIHLDSPPGGPTILRAVLPCE